MPADPYRVTAEHIQGLAAAGNMRGNRTVLASTDEGLRYVSPEAILAKGSGVRRMLLTFTDLQEDAVNAGLTLAAYVKANAKRIAAELNDLLAEKGDA